MILATAIAAMCVGVIAAHTGLTSAIARTFMRIAACYQCTTFWLTLTVLIAFGYHAIASTMLAVIMSYLSHYVVLLLIYLQHIYNILCAKQEKMQEQKHRHHKKQSHR